MREPLVPALPQNGRAQLTDRHRTEDSLLSDQAALVSTFELPAANTRAKVLMHVRTYEQANAVAIGSFNPAIFHPTWFEENKILPAAEVEFALSPGEGSLSAMREVPLLVTKEVTQVQFESLLLKVTQERFELHTERPDWIRDIGPILSSIFRALIHTPVSILGFNVTTHRAGRSKDVLATWLPLAPLVNVVGEAEPKTGLPRITGSVKANWDGYRALLTMESSTKVPNGVHLTQNFERTLSGGAKELIEVAQKDWERILERANQVAVRILESKP